MAIENRIYLDHSATSWPKPAAVLDAMDRFARFEGRSAGRGGYRSALNSDAVVMSTRRAIARLINAESPDCISFHANGTAALNAAIGGMIRQNDHVVTTAAEHNSVLRPLHHLQKTRNLRLTIVPCDEQGIVVADQLMAAVTDETRMVALTHANNVTGAIQPISDVGARLQGHPAILLCDAAQTFGAIPIDVLQSGIDLLAAPGHKAGRGPLGTGFLYAATGVHDQLTPVLQGGTGSQSESLEMPHSLPAKLEAGNLNVPALAGWLAGLSDVDQIEIEQSQRRCQELASMLHTGLGEIEHVRVFGQPCLLPIASIAVEGLSPVDLASVLDVDFHIEARAGLHCAALIHHHLGSDPEGTVRISAGATTTDEEIKAVTGAIQVIAASVHAV